MNSKTQDKNHNGLFCLSDYGAYIAPGEVKELIKALTLFTKKSCNVATEPTPLVRSLFESINDPNVLTIYVRTDQEYHDISVALKPRREGNTALIGAIIYYYKERESLNIILSHQVMDNQGDTFYRSTAQYAQQLSSTYNSEFPKIKALYDTQRKELGIFCRKVELDMSLTFLGQMTNQLKKVKQLIISYDQMPDTYVTYPSMLHHKVKSKLENPEIKMIKLKKGLRFIIPEKSKIVVDGTLDSV